MDVRLLLARSEPAVCHPCKPVSLRLSLLKGKDQTQANFKYNSKGGAVHGEQKRVGGAQRTSFPLIPQLTNTKQSQRDSIYRSMMGTDTSTAS
jgi:hypothetical protein